MTRAELLDIGKKLKFPSVRMRIRGEVLHEGEKAWLNFLNYPTADQLGWLETAVKLKSSGPREIGVIANDES